MLHLMGLSLSNSQIAAELDLDPDVAQHMAKALRQKLCAGKAGCKLKGVVECDEVYVVAAHKSNPVAVRSKSSMLSNAVVRWVSSCCPTFRQEPSNRSYAP